MMKKLIQTKCPLLVLGCHVCALTLLLACNQPSYRSPEGYDLKKPVKMELGKVLNEISGLTWYPANNALLAISDSKDKVFEINIDKRKLKDYTDKVVGPQNDLEDLVKVDSMLYLLSSKGIIYQIPPDKRMENVVAYTFSPDTKNDFETLYYDPQANSLVMLCKTCAFEKDKGTHSAFRFDLKTKTFDSTAFYTIDDQEVYKMVKDDNAKFRPSAAAIHPLNNRLYILASAGNLLVIADTHGQVLEVYHLNPDEFPQAEGIAFAPNGDMYISNEGKYGGKATLLQFSFQNGKKQ
jgi:SdiA-regulated